MKPTKTSLKLTELQDILRLTLQAVPGCAHIQSVKILREAAGWNRPNWDVTEILPPVPDHQAGVLACSAIEQLRRKFDLAT